MLKYKKIKVDLPNELVIKSLELGIFDLIITQKGTRELTKVIKKLPSLKPMSVDKKSPQKKNKK